MDFICTHNCNICRHCIAVPYTACADGFECLIDVCEKNDPHFMYSKEKVEGPCEKFSKKNEEKDGR